MDPAPPDLMTIDELARRTGLTVRNIRAHQTRGLLPPPQVKARTGYYGPDHVARVELIKEMQGAGFNLQAIKNMLDAVPIGAGEEALRFERLLLAPWSDEEPEVITADELRSRFPGSDDRSLRKARSLGLLRDLGEDRYEVPSPSLLRAGEAVVATGVPVERALAVVDKVQDHAKGVARAFTKLFLDEVWRPFKAAGMPEDQLPQMQAALEQLRSLAADVLLSSFRLQMSEAVESAFGSELKKPIGK